MCGINGIVSTKEHPDLSHEVVKCMNDKIPHRGPDDEGFFMNYHKNYHLDIAMHRLSIIDLNCGAQPIYSEDKKKVIVFNGEIYNYRELKKGLESEGIFFRTNSDTEVILKLYEKEGVSSFGRLDGMFAFSIYDQENDRIFLARDFFGEKPLYYTQQSNDFYWASELKSITAVLPSQPDISITGLNLFFQLTYIPAPFTIYENIFKLEANHYLEYDCQNRSLEIKEIQQNTKDVADWRKLDLIQYTHDLVQESVKSRSVSDVPLGTFLSGGVDSSIVSLCLSKQTSSKIDTFSIGFDKKEFDETDKSDLVARLIGSHHHKFIIGEKDLKEDLDKVLLNFDEPFADSSSLASFIVAQKTREYVKVALTGDGGDEVFGGYNKYYMGRMNRKYTSFVPREVHYLFNKTAGNLLSSRVDNRGLRFKVKRLMQSVDYGGDFYYNIISLGFQQKELMSLFSSEWFKDDSLFYFKKKFNRKAESIRDFQKIDRMLSLEGDMLVKVDRTGMLNSLESRSPFLNKKLWDFTSHLPEKYLIHGWNKKFLLKRAFEKYFPEGFLNKSKQGFGVPVGDWLRTGLKQELAVYTDKDFINRQGIFNHLMIKTMVQQHVEGKMDNTFRVWTYYCFQKWFTKIYETFAVNV